MSPCKATLFRSLAFFLLSFLCLAHANLRHDASLVTARSAQPRVEHEYATTEEISARMAPDTTAAHAALQRSISDVSDVEEASDLDKRAADVGTTPRRKPYLGNPFLLRSPYKTRTITIEILKDIEVLRPGDKVSWDITYHTYTNDGGLAYVIGGKVDRAKGVEEASFQASSVYWNSHTATSLQGHPIFTASGHLGNDYWMTIIIEWDEHFGATFPECFFTEPVQIGAQITHFSEGFALEDNQFKGTWI